MSVGVSRWYEVLSDWIDFGSEVHFVFYEELKEDLVAELRKLLEHLKLPVDETRLTCIRDHSTG